MKKTLLGLVMSSALLFSLELPSKVAYWTSWNGMNKNTGKEVAAADVDGILLSFGKWDSNGTIIGSDGMIDIPSYKKSSMPFQYTAWTQAKFANPKTKYLVAFGGQTYASIWATLNTEEGRKNVAQNLYDLVTTKFPVYKKKLEEDEIVECKSTKLVDPSGALETIWDNEAGTQMESEGVLQWKNWGKDENNNTCTLEAQNCPLMTGAMVPNPNYHPIEQCDTTHYNVAGYVELDGLDFDFEKPTRITETEGENLRKTIQLLRDKLTTNGKDKLISLTTYHVGADPVSCENNSNFKNCSFVESDRSTHHGEVKQLLKNSLGLFDFYNVMAYDAGHNFRWDVAIKNYADIVGADKVNLGITINHQWASDGSFVESKANNINRAKYVKDNGYLGYFVWNLGASTTQMPFSDQVSYLNDLGQSYKIGGNTYDAITDDEARTLFGAVSQGASSQDTASQDASSQGAASQELSQDAASQDAVSQDAVRSVDINTSLNLIKNGSFEMNSKLKRRWFVSRNTANWTYSSATRGIEVWTPRLGKAATDGDYKIELDLDRGRLDEISQTITGAYDMYKYQLSLDAYARTRGSSDFEVLVNGKLVMKVIPTSKWVRYSTTFTGSSTMVVSIRELSQQNDGLGAILDNVKLVNTGVLSANRVQFVNIYRFGNLQTTEVRFSSSEYASDPTTYGGYIRWMTNGETIVITK